MRIEAWALLIAGALTLQAQAEIPADVARLMDTRADPCEDFYQYACGAWLQNTTLPSDRQSYAYSFNTISDRNDRVIQEIASQRPPLVGEFWDACMALEELTSRGSAPLQPLMEQIAAATTKRELLLITASVGASGPNMVVAIGVGADVRDATTNVLYASNGDLTLPAASYYLDNATFKSVESAYRQYIRMVLRLAGVVRTAEEEARAETVVTALERKVAEITPTPEQARDSIASYNPLNYSEATAKYPLAFGALGDGLRLLERSTLTPHSKIVVRSLAYFDEAETLLATTELSDLRLYLVFLYVNYYSAYLGEPFLQARFELFGKTLSGLKTRAPRDRACTRTLMTFLPDVVGAEYSRRMFDAQSAEEVEAMVHAVEHALRDRLESLDWLDEFTRAHALNKLACVANLIGQSKTKRRHLPTLARDDYMGNVVALTTNVFDLALQKLAQPVDRSEWAISPAEVNAYYSATQNKMVLPAAIFLPPFFSLLAHAAQNFGAIGAVIGHELTHGFDSNGRKFDGTGTAREWWTRATATRFEARAQCLRDQYSAFPVVGDHGDVLGFVDGSATLGENIADNGGVSLALDAYRRSLEVSRAEPDERLFFLAFGQLWCTRSRDVAQRQQLLTREPHAPARWRVNGVAMNSQAFARAFQCRPGSRLHPPTKCALLW